MKKTYKITGMDCPSCAALLELDLEDAGIVAKCSYQKSVLEVEGTKNFDTIRKIVEKNGCKFK